jgi:hypothetical protein
MVSQALDGITDDRLLEIIGTVGKELRECYMKFSTAIEYKEIKCRLAYTENDNIYYRDEVFNSIDEARDYAIHLMRTDERYYFPQIM